MRLVYSIMICWLPVHRGSDGRRRKLKKRYLHRVTKSKQLNYGIWRLGEKKTLSAAFDLLGIIHCYYIEIFHVCISTRLVLRNVVSVMSHQFKYCMNKGLIVWIRPCKIINRLSIIFQYLIKSTLHLESKVLQNYCFVVIDFEDFKNLFCHSWGASSRE